MPKKVCLIVPVPPLKKVLFFQEIKTTTSILIEALEEDFSYSFAMMQRRTCVEKFLDIGIKFNFLGGSDIAASYFKFAGTKIQMITIDTVNDFENHLLNSNKDLNENDSTRDENDDEESMENNGVSIHSNYS